MPLQCPSCHSVNREGRRFCTRCGTALTIQCDDCGLNNGPESLFCGNCGKALFDPDENSPFHENRKNRIDGCLHPIRTMNHPERRHLTVMLCDLVNSTRLASSIDPEDLRQVIREYQGVCVAVIERK